MSERIHEFGSVRLAEDEFGLEHVCFSLSEAVPEDHPFAAVREVGFEEVRVSGSCDNEGRAQVWVIGIMPLKWPDVPFVSPDHRGTEIADARVEYIVDNSQHRSRWAELRAGHGEMLIDDPPVTEDAWKALEALRDSLNQSHELSET